MPNKIGILTYYWPPAGGSGVQRWLNFANELSDIGNDVHVFTFKNSKYPVIDNELYKKIGDSYIDWHKKNYLNDSKKYLKYIGITNFILNNGRTLEDF